MTIFLLFESDQWSTKSSRIPCGAFSTEQLAITAAKENGMYNDKTTVLIIGVELDNFEEL